MICWNDNLKGIRVMIAVMSIHSLFIILRDKLKACLKFLVSFQGNFWCWTWSRTEERSQRQSQTCKYSNTV